MSKSNPNKAPKQTAKDELDELIEWYERNKPSAGQRIQVNIGPKMLAKQLGVLHLVKKGEEPPTEQPYRGRIVIATGKD